MPITAIAADAAKAGMRNSSRRSIGDALRLSTVTNATMNTAKATKEATTGAEPQPSEGPWMMLYSRVSMATAMVICPGQSSERPYWGP
ncbi:hypothetical protein [Streptomyces sp. NPDC001388]|uniref:hypothetical protein n=1 Tax=Streptomyces sp. NPDC001388 TaxID=3364568 RepID=UPI0036A2EF78